MAEACMAPPGQAQSHRVCAHSDLAHVGLGRREPWTGRAYTDSPSANVAF